MPSVKSASSLFYWPSMLLLFLFFGVEISSPFFSVLLGIGGNFLRSATYHIRKMLRIDRCFRNCGEFSTFHLHGMSALENALARLEFLRSVDRCGKAYSDNRGGVAFPVDIWVDRVLIILDIR